ncbi:MAG: alpha-L-rhamnosidase [Ruminococcaceae bacterium]|nr:alpha-L-rhamnosidase [Oscillospiraceae bacterium]
MMRFIGDDDRKRSFVLPSRVVLTSGKVEGAENLLQERPMMLHFNEQCLAWLDNRESHENAGILLDFGRELHGGIRLLCPEVSPRARVRIRFGESVGEALTPVGERGATNDHDVRDFEVAMPWLSDQEWGQTGFRFVYLELLGEEAYVAFKATTAVFVRRDLPYRGSFRCNDPRVNEIFDTAAYTCHLCMQTHLWDGIKRDRLIWIGDSHPEMLTIRSVFGRQEILEDSLTALKEATPLPGWMNTMPTYSLWWLYILADWYRYTGDRQFPDTHKAYILDLTDILLNHIDEQGLMNLGDFFLDWPSRGAPDAMTGVQALAVQALEGVQELLPLWEEPERQQRVATAVRTLRGYLPTDATYKPAVAMAYLAGMISKEQAGAKLSGGVSGYSTFMSYYLLTATAKALDMTTALQNMRTYYGGMLDRGATTFWEDFHIEWLDGSAPLDRLPREGEKDIHGDFGDHCYRQYRHSLCHGWSSGPVPFLMENVLGIHFDSPGGSHITLSPDLGDLTYAEGRYPLPQGGEVWVRCEQTPDGLHTVYTAPEGIVVTVR